ncbi:MAG TPA: GNAT family N-acetyltransferase [Actinomycetota bacterium]|nr:GNAT family N-acetyltransferase [Actinomycetota bacterium]
MAVRPLHGDDAPACDAIITALPDWFGDEHGIRDCAEAVRSQPGFVATVDATIVGFLTVVRPRPHVAEISWMAVHPEHRGSGHGRALIDALVRTLHGDETRFLAVKTLSDRDPYPPYAETRAFYEAMGFLPLMDLDIWGPENPGLLLVRSVAQPRSGVPAPTVDDLLVAARARGERVAPAQAHDEAAAHAAILVDQRTLEQRRDHGDIPGAVTMSMTVVPWRLDPQSRWKIPGVIDHDTRVLIVCQEGYSSSLSVEWLRDLGMRNVADVEGGFEAWRDAGLPVEPHTED